MIHFKTDAMVYAACFQLLDDGRQKLEVSSRMSEVDCPKCREAVMSPTHYATHPHSVILCKRKVIAMHLGMRGWTRDEEKVTCPRCRELLTQKSNSRE